MTCPDCEYVLGAFEADCSRCARLGRPEKSCLGCGAASPVKALFCQQCSRRFGDPLVPTSVSLTAAEAPAAVVVPPRDNLPSVQSSGAPSSPGAIFWMWLLSFIAWIAFLSGGVAFGFLADIVAIIIAFNLVRSRSSISTGNGWTKLVLEDFAFVIGFVNAMNVAG
jgi:hypothetical protein